LTEFRGSEFVGRGGKGTLGGVECHLPPRADRLKLKRLEGWPGDVEGLE
jgi:hypothetical protein